MSFEELTRLFEGHTGPVRRNLEFDSNTLDEITQGKIDQIIERLNQLKDFMERFDSDQKQVQ
jgi:hypothetical protein